MADSPAAVSSRTVQQQSPATALDAARVVLVLALALTALAYLNTLRFQFVYDDLPQIVNNPQVHSWQYVPRFFTSHVWSQYSRIGNYYRPLFQLWLLLGYSVFGLNPFGWHLLTLLMHIAVTAMVYLLARRVTGDRLTAAVATVIFGLHPTHIETVAWISGVTDSLLGVFFIGSVLAYIRAREAASRRVMWTALSVAWFALAILAKETGIVLPAILYAYDRLIAPVHGAREPRAARFRRYWPYLVIVAAYVPARQFALRGIGHSEPKPWLDVLLTLPTFLWFYVRDLIWPVGLSVFHDIPLVHRPGMTNFVLPLLGVAAAVVVLMYASRGSREAAFAAWWLALLMVPPIIGVYAFVPEDLVHDRYLYLPSVGLALIIAAVIRRLPSRRHELFGGPAPQMATVLVLACLLGTTTALQNVFWANDLILYAHAVQVAPRNVIALDHLANEMYKRKRPDQAVELYRRSLAISSEHWATHFALGITLFETGRLAEAEREFDVSIRQIPGNADRYYYLGLVQLQGGRYSEAELNLRRAIDLFDTRPSFHYALGMALEKQGRVAQARQAYAAELKIGPFPPATEALARLRDQ